jgi:hypothetical protein
VLKPHGATVCRPLLFASAGSALARQRRVATSPAALLMAVAVPAPSPLHRRAPQAVVLLACSAWLTSLWGAAAGTGMSGAALDFLRWRALGAPVTVLLLTLQVRPPPRALLRPRCLPAICSPLPAARCAPRPSPARPSMPAATQKACAGACSRRARCTAPIAAPASPATGSSPAPLTSTITPPTPFLAPARACSGVSRTRGRPSTQPWPPASSTLCWACC